MRHQHNAHVFITKASDWSVFARTDRLVVPEKVNNYSRHYEQLVVDILAALLLTYNNSMKTLK